MGVVWVNFDMVESWPAHYLFNYAIETTVDYLSSSRKCLPDRHNLKSGLLLTNLDHSPLPKYNTYTRIDPWSVWRWWSRSILGSCGGVQWTWRLNTPLQYGTLSHLIFYFIFSLSIYTSPQLHHAVHSLQFNLIHIQVSPSSSYLSTPHFSFTLCPPSSPKDHMHLTQPDSHPTSNQPTTTKPGPHTYIHTSLPTYQTAPRENIKVPCPCHLL